MVLQEGSCMNMQPTIHSY